MLSDAFNMLFAVVRVKNQRVVDWVTENVPVRK